MEETAILLRSAQRPLCGSVRQSVHTADSVEKLTTVLFQGTSKPFRKEDRRIRSDWGCRSFWLTLPFRQKVSFSTASANSGHSRRATLAPDFEQNRGLFEFEIRSTTLDGDGHYPHIVRIFNLVPDRFRFASGFHRLVPLVSM